METLTSIRLNCQQLLDKPRIYADLNGGWRSGDQYVVLLNSHATESDLRQPGYTLKPGLVLDFWTDDSDEDGNLDPLLFQGEVGFDEETQNWYVATSWGGFTHASELNQPQAEPARSAERELAAHAG